MSQILAMVCRLSSVAAINAKLKRRLAKLEHLLGIVVEQRRQQLQQQQQ